MTLLSWLQESFVNLVVAIVIMLIGHIFSIVLSKFVKRILGELETDRILQKSGLRIKVERSLSRLVRYVILIAAFILALNQLGIISTLVSVIFIILSVILVIIVVFSVKDLIYNSFYGLLIKWKKMIKIGKNISVKGVSGKVIKFGLSDTIIEDSDGDIIMVPNSFMFKNLAH